MEQHMILRIPSLTKQVVRCLSNHGLVKLANSACVDVKKRFQELEEKLFGMSVRTKARSKHFVSSNHYEIEINLGNKANM
jgi:hypothetical protein